MQDATLIFEYISVVTLIIVSILFVITGIGTLNAHRQKANKAKLTYGIGFLFAAVGMALLVCQRIFFKILPATTFNLNIGLICSAIAVAASMTSMVSVNIFTILMTYPDKMKYILPIFVTCAAIPVIVLDYAMLSGIASVVAGELEYPTLIQASLLLLLPVMFIPPIVFFYYAIKTRTASAPNFKRSMTLGAAHAVLAVTYIVELLGLPNPYLAMAFRIGFFIFAFLMYLSLLMPDWYKNRIGWTED